ncbi:PD-(D/E)XK nuclease superfamily [uncultured Caudovirales phage]|uniref:PD-(D/E)XK nuclease superfamily n=1 Tax=uncultured Caudovirales phage TaxID=2100421 RepID=A0A6J5KRM8_9CAUD|nr:PD-(D/E)XK nuclease superfamily [uncultured Caudovirales phage]
MKMTNNWGLPLPLYNALAADNYSKGMADFSVTGLLAPPKIAMLKELYHDELSEDVSSRLWSTFGTVVHEIIEKGSVGLPNHTAEQRLYAVVDGQMISGGIDLQIYLNNDTHELVDWKTTTSWAVINGKIDWENQLNIYAFLMRKNKNATVSSLKVGAIIRDWKKVDAQFKMGYPPRPVMMIDIPLWSEEDQEEFVRDRIATHTAARMRHELSGEFPDCTPEEMWESGGGWAVLKAGANRASKIYPDQVVARAVASANPGARVERRPSTRLRCEEYCSCASVCEQYKQWMMEKNGV